MKTSLDKESLLDLIHKARTGKIVLPQFQRNFVWSRDAITDLILSIFQGYFIGSFLLLDVDKDNVPFAMRPIEGVDLRPKDLRPEKMILDGQQRLTSLHYVFAAPDIPLRWTKKPYRFFLDLRKLAEGDLENAIWSERADYVSRYFDRAYQFENLVVPFTELENWRGWLDAYEDWLWEKGPEAVATFRQTYRAPWSDYLDRLKAFQVPIIEIDKVNPKDQDAIAQVCAIFEKMNSTGVRLSVYDLLTARMYRYGVDMHRLWEQSVARHSYLADISDGKPDTYGVFLLRIIALLRGLDVKSKTIINLSHEDFARDWERAAEGMNEALQRITSTGPDGFGAFTNKWIPYSTMVSPMAAFLVKIRENKWGHEAYSLLRRWYWASVFRERYAGAVESTIYRDYQDLLAAMKGGSEPAALADARTNILENEHFTLLDTSRVNAIYRGVMCLVALRGAKDFQADDSIEFHVLDDHHIFPKGAFKKLRQVNGEPYPKKLIDCVINRTLISSATNRRISKSLPSNYVRRLIPTDRKEEILASHFINQRALQAMQEDDFDAFLLAREQSLLAEIRRRLTS